MGRVLPVFREAIDHWIAHSTPQTAAGLAYYTVFSLAPLLLIAISIAGIVMGEDQARAQIVEQATGLVGPAGRTAVEGMLGDAADAPKAGAIGTVVGLVTLLIGAVGVLAQLKSALNTVWHAEAPPFSWGGLARQYLSNMALVVATGFLLMVSLVATAAIGVATARLRTWLAGPEGLWIALDAGVGFLMTGALFGLIFKTLPDAEVHWRDVRVGAFVTAILFTAGRLGLGWYLGREGGDSAYAAAASLLALLAWVYYSSQLVLFGAEFTYAYAHRYGSRAGHAYPEPPTGPAGGAASAAPPRAAGATQTRS
jgi:membrane protein